MAEADDKLDLTDADSVRAGEAVARLPQPEPPHGLASRTVARVIKECQPIRKVIWLLRPITNPLARLAAAALIIVTLTPMTDLDMADPLGARIEHQLIGRRLADRIEVFVDRLLVIHGPPYYSQDDLDAFMGIQRLPMPRRLQNPKAAPGHQV